MYPYQSSWRYSSAGQRMEKTYVLLVKFSSELDRDTHERALLLHIRLLVYATFSCHGYFWWLSYLSYALVCVISYLMSILLYQGHCFRVQIYESGRDFLSRLPFFWIFVLSLKFILEWAKLERRRILLCLLQTSSFPVKVKCGFILSFRLLFIIHNPELPLTFLYWPRSSGFILDLRFLPNYANLYPLSRTATAFVNCIHKCPQCAKINQADLQR